ncbi:hypothetical protein H0E87_031032 [Populus deltoides]|uniref:AAA-type ATPase N-terminal domain-containing protein n=1 Tax=Populus deltoides TaxID=3696 RepID=A0A8T2WJ73_POPDE|nr:hypothetical protein H0E87_031032 [Populus deltoides]
MNSQAIASCVVKAYSAIENYLGSRSSTQAKRLKADVVKNNQSVVLSMDDYEEVDDDIQGVKLGWASGKHISKSQSVSFYPVTDEKKYYKLTFHKRHRQLILGDYLNHVLKEDNEIKVRNRQRKLYTNSGSYWRHVVFQHPASFETLAMEAERKQEIVDDLVIFSTAEDFYLRIGRAWKRGYLLFGPRGTGKEGWTSTWGLSYCSFEAFQVLAKNYLRPGSHRLFARDPGVVGETKMTPAEVAEHLMPKTITGDIKVCLESLIGALEEGEEDAILKAEEEKKKRRRRVLD